MNKPQDDLLAAKLNETGRYTASERATGPWLVAYYEAEADYWRRHGGAPQNEPPGNSYECTEHVARCVWEAALASIGQAAPPDREELAKGLHDAYHGGCTRGHLAEADYVLSIWPKAAQPPREQYLSLVCERDELKGRLAETESDPAEAPRRPEDNCGASMSILLVDLSAIVTPHYHAHGKRFGGDQTSDAAVASIRNLASEFGQDGVAICCDCPGVKTWRHEVSSHYKATRPEWDKVLLEQYDRAKGILAQSWPVFAVDGFEADDIVATAVAHLWPQPVRFVVASSDKDLAQTVCSRVSLYHTGKRRLLDPAGVLEVCGVRPDQIRDLLCLMGDSGDCVDGVPGIGEVTAKKILANTGTLLEAFRVAFGPAAETLELPKSKLAALQAGVASAELARKLVTLRKDVPIDCSRILRRGAA